MGSGVQRRVQNECNERASVSPPTAGARPAKRVRAAAARFRVQGLGFRHTTQSSAARRVLVRGAQRKGAEVRQLAQRLIRPAEMNELI